MRAPIDDFLQFVFHIRAMKMNRLLRDGFELIC